MNDKLNEIKLKLEDLLSTINDYFDSLSQEKIIILKGDFHNISCIGKISLNDHVFSYNKGLSFRLRDDIFNTYESEILKKIISGDLDRIILVKSKNVIINGFLINYELENEHETKLRDLYPGDSSKE